MDARPGTIDDRIQLQSAFSGAPKTPIEFVCISPDVLQISEFVFLPIMPEHRFTKDKPERHFVGERFQSARGCARAGKMRMRPSPEVAMPVSTIVSLNSDPQRASVKTPPIQRDPARKDSIGMRSSREADPAFIAERDAKRRTIIQIPCNCVPLNFEYASTGILADLVLADSKVEGILAFATEIQSLQGKSLNEALRFPTLRKPGRPDLYWQSPEITNATATAGIHQQIPEPPRSRAVRESQSKKPHFIPAPGGKRRIQFVQCFHRQVTRQFYCFPSVATHAACFGGIISG